MDKRRNIFNGLVLALDVGVASLGWCMRQGEKILKSGVLIFPESILRKNGIETILTPAALRRKYRMTRRLNARRRLRKYHVLKLLIEHAMCPLTYEELRRWLATKEYPLSNLDFKNWGGSDHSRNPYIFRYRAVHEKLSPYDLGRVFYHLAQRRGFKSSRKARIIDNNSDMEQSSTDLGKTYNEIERVSEELRKRNCTLGEYFYELHEKNEKIRTMHLGRVEHYEKEFEKICEVQQLSEELRHKLYNALFFQRPLRPQKRGLCALEPKHPRTIAGHPLFEEFRLLAFVNNLKVRPLGSREMYTPLSIAQRSKIIEKASQRKTQGDFDVKFLKKLIFSKTGKGHNAIEYEFNYADGVSVPICETSVRLQDVFGCHVYEWRHEYITKNNRTIVWLSGCISSVV